MPSGSVLLLAQPNSGGVARHVCDLAAGLAARERVVKVGCPPGGELARCLTDAQVAVEPIEYVRRLSPRQDWASFVATRRAVRRFAPAIVHCHSSKAGFVGRAAARSLGVGATVYTPHCLAMNAYSGMTGRVYAAAERLAGVWTGRFIAVADAEADQIVASGLGPRERVRRVYNGITAVAAPDPERRATLRAAWGAERADSVVFAIVGRADRQKAFDVFIDAALAAGPAADLARFVVVGGDYTSEGALDTYRARIDEAGAQGRIHLVGDRGDVDDILAASDVLVMPSRWEAFPYVLLEAGARGLAVIATPVGGVPEVVADEQSGLLVPTDDAESLARAMVRLAHDHDLRARLGNSLADRVRPLTADAMVDETIAVYDELLAEIGRRGRR